MQTYAIGTVMAELSATEVMADITDRRTETVVSIGKVNAAKPKI